MKPRYIYNTSDIGYMDEEWINQVPVDLEESNKVDEKLKSQDEQELKKVQ
jgi:hypothetical protein